MNSIPLIRKTKIKKKNNFSRFQFSVQAQEFCIWAISAVFLIFLWEWIVRHYEVSPTFFPSPLNVGYSLFENLADGTFLKDLKTTLLEVAIGFTAGSLLGIVVAVLIAEFRLAKIIIYPYIVCLQSIPKTAIAPMLLVWFGFGIESKVALVMLSSFFPVLVNTLSGVTRSDPEQLAMLKAFCGKRWLVFRKVKFPSALPSLFAGLELAIMLSLIGAIISEYLGAQGGLGYRIQILNSNLEMAAQFAALILLAFTGFVLHGTIKAIGRHLIFWGKPASDGDISI